MHGDAASMQLISWLGQAQVDKFTAAVYLPQEYRV